MAPAIPPSQSAVASCTAFVGTRLLARGTPADVARAVSAARAQAAPEQPLLVFDDRTGAQIELDPAAAAAPAPAEPAVRRRGRPQLGVVAREVTLLPRHWDWLAHQPGGASVALRRLVEEKMRMPSWLHGVRQAQERSYSFLTAIAGNLPGYEEAIRRLFRREAAGFEAAMAGWPVDIREHARRLSTGAFTPNPDTNDIP